MRYLTIEFLRAWRSFVMYLPGVVLVAAGLAAALGVSGAAHGLAMLHFYPVALLMPLAIMTPILTQRREQNLRGGGTLWRPQNTWATLSARLAVATIFAALGHAVAPLPVVGVSQQAAEFFVLETLVFMGGYGIGLLLWQLSRKFSLALGPLVALSFVGMGVIGADSDGWYRNPLSWHVRATLPVYGVNHNSTAAAPGSGIYDISPVWPVAGHVTMGLVCFVLAVCLAARRRRRGYSGRVLRGRSGKERRVSAPAVAGDRVPGDPGGSGELDSPGDPAGSSDLGGRGRVSALRAFAITLPWRVWSALAVVMWGIIALVRWRYEVEASAALYGLFAVPLVASVVAIMGWNAQRDAWRGLVQRPRAHRLFPALLVLLGVFSCVSLLPAGLLAGATWYQFIVTPGLVAAVLAVTFLSAVVSLGAGFVVTLVGVVWSLIVGGSVLAVHPLWWRTGPWAWAYVAGKYPERWLEIALVTWAVCGVTVVLGNRVLQAKISGANR